jgi:hypothetical protein
MTRDYGSKLSIPRTLATGRYGQSMAIGFDLIDRLRSPLITAIRQSQSIILRVSENIKNSDIWPDNKTVMCIKV